MDCLRALQELCWSWTLDAACVARLSVLNSHVWQTKCTREQTINADKKGGPNHQNEQGITATGDLINFLCHRASFESRRKGLYQCGGVQFTTGIVRYKKLAAY